jgi:hypothetical protein
MVGDPRGIAPRMAKGAKKFESAFKFHTLCDTEKGGVNCWNAAHTSDGGE